MQESERKISEILPKKAQANEKVELLKEDLDAYDRAFDEATQPEDVEEKLRMLQNISDVAVEVNDNVQDLNARVSDCPLKPCVTDAP